MIRWTGDVGATMIELLVSLAILSMLSALLVAGVGERGLAWTRLDRDTANAEVVEAVQMLLHDRLERIWPETTYDFMQPRPDFEGASDHIEFIGPPPAVGTPGPLRRYRLAVDASGELVLDSRSELALDRTRWSERQVLMRRVQALDIDYYGRGGGTQPAWRADWTRMPSLPDLVRLRLGFADGDRRRWPDLTVRPAADVDTACLVEAASQCNTR